MLRSSSVARLTLLMSIFKNLTLLKRLDIDFNVLLALFELGLFLPLTFFIENFKHWLTLFESELDIIGSGRPGNTGRERGGGGEKYEE